MRGFVPHGERPIRLLVGLAFFLICLIEWKDGATPVVRRGGEACVQQGYLWARGKDRQAAPDVAK